MSSNNYTKAIRFKSFNLLFDESIIKEISPTLFGFKIHNLIVEWYITVNLFKIYRYMIIIDDTDVDDFITILKLYYTDELQDLDY